MVKRQLDDTLSTRIRIHEPTRRDRRDLLAPRLSRSQLWWTEPGVRRLTPLADPWPVTIVGFDQFQECAVRILEAEELGSGFIAEADYLWLLEIPKARKPLEFWKTAP